MFFLLQKNKGEEFRGVREVEMMETLPRAGLLQRELSDADETELFSHILVIENQFWQPRRRFCAKLQDKTFVLCR